jgi:hypothetical protein
MTEATGVTLRRVDNCGCDPLYEIYCSAGSTANTLTIPTVNTEITTSSVIKVVSVTNTTNGYSQGYFDGASRHLYATYSKSARAFTIVDVGSSNEAYRIEFKIVQQDNSA